MKKGIALVFAALLICTAVLAGGCVFNLFDKETKETPMTESDSQSNATIILEGNPTTGYEWFFTISPEGVVILSSADYVVDNPDADGSGGTYFFTFEPVSPGKAEITFEYYRDWEDDPPLDTEVYQATVDEELNLTLTKLK